jgi:heavy metal sensor kinase
VGVVEVGLATADVDETLDTLLVVILVAYPLALLAAGAGGLFLANRALSPIDTVTRAAREISGSDLSRRLELDLPDDEVGRLSRTFDEMIARLEEAFRRQRQFTADASHELRTPLTAIKGQAEVALQRERTVEEYREVLRSVNADVDRMIRLVGTLLLLTRADAEQIPVTREPMSVGETLRAAVEQVRAGASAKGVQVSAEDAADVVVRADEDLVLQLVLNLLDNAVRYTPDGGTVTAAWRPFGTDVEIVVEDTGPGIAPEHLPHVFERFYRAESARSREDGGAGLGLSICKWIAEAHGGTITVESPPGTGARFIVRFPAN